MINSVHLRQLADKAKGLPRDFLLHWEEKKYTFDMPMAGAEFTIATSPEAVLELLDERSKLIRVLKEAREAIALEDARLESGELRLGQWTPLNGVREAVRDSKEIEA